MGTGTPVARLIVLEPDVRFKAVVALSLLANRNLGDVWAHLGVESVPIHAEIPGSVLEPHNPGLQNDGSSASGFRGHSFAWAC